MPPNTPKDPAATAQASLRAWGVFYVFWTIVHYSLGIGGALLAAASTSKFFDDHTKSMIGWLSAGCIAALTFISPRKLAKQYHSAWAQLIAVIRRYECNDGKNGGDVLDALDEGEKIVSKVFDF